jgi:5'-deoxynucleotidase YfbR-like HD superfamily hydrolase
MTATSYLERRFGNWMQTYSGRMFWPMDPRASDVHIEDIAHALSQQCRYAGHSDRFYSVAEHCVLVSRSVRSAHNLWGLLHDASEAYLVDIPRPLKPYLTNYADIEGRVMAAICERFGLLESMPDEVRSADERICNDERDALLKPPPMPWAIDPNPIGVTIRGLPPTEAKAEFLEEFNRLMEKRSAA